LNLHAKKYSLRHRYSSANGSLRFWEFAAAENQAAMLGFTTTALSRSNTKVSFEEHSPHNQKCERLREEFVEAMGSLGACGRTSN
jgi:hypothetical protein